MVSRCSAVFALSWSAAFLLLHLSAGGSTAIAAFLALALAVCCAARSTPLNSAFARAGEDNACGTAPHPMLGDLASGASARAGGAFPRTPLWQKPGRVARTDGEAEANRVVRPWHFESSSSGPPPPPLGDRRPVR